MPADVPDGDDAAGERAVSVQTDVSAGGASIWFLNSQRRNSLHFALVYVDLDFVNNSLVFFFLWQISKYRDLLNNKNTPERDQENNIESRNGYSNMQVVLPRFILLDK